MKEQRTIAVSVCDAPDCGKTSDYMSSCERCGREYCFNHRDALIVYPHHVYASGSGDLSLCVECHEAAKATADKELLAYIAIQDLRAERKRFCEDFDARATAATNLVESYYRARFAKEQPK